ncbi:hypothetical protein [Ectobacillus funiculus]|nr:hypothetical protein [Ectobacillus funiculus]
MYLYVGARENIQNNCLEIRRTVHIYIDDKDSSPIGEDKNVVALTL